MLALWLITFALTVSPRFHRWLHEDADSPTHTCVITQIQQQQPLLAGFAAVVAPVPLPVQPAYVPLADIQFVPRGDYRLSPSRAPPLISAIPVA